MARKFEKNNLTQNLNYLGLDLEKLPKLPAYTKLDFRPSKTYSDENNYKTYRYLDVNEIKILLTPTNRLDLLEEKYLKAAPLEVYLNPEDQDDMERHAVLLDMLKNINKEEIERIEKEQEEFQNQIPFKVRYDKNYLWQIYYSEFTDQYFMLVPTKETNYSCFFYLLKKQIENSGKKKADKIYVPICYMEYDGKYLKRSEITDLENYLWLFTKDWATIHEVYDIKNKLSIQIVGTTNVYEGIKSSYKIALENAEEAGAAYKLIKALFILQTELPNEYHFKVKINEKGSIDFYYKDQHITYESLSKFIKKECDLLRDNIETVVEENNKLSKAKQELLKITNEKYLIYLKKEKQITLFMQCKKSFLGKISYYLKTRKSMTKTEDTAKSNASIDEKSAAIEETDITQYEPIPDKDLYTIDDLIQYYKRYNNYQTQLKNNQLDIKALENKNQNMEMRIKNADLYLKEIDNHKKSIFEFWKFTKKDDVLTLNKAEEESQEDNIKLEKTFSYEEDLEDLGKQLDMMQREKLTNKECDAVYIANTEILKDINVLLDKNGKNQLTDSFQQTKEKFAKERLSFYEEDFDIFGGASKDKAQVLKEKSHRESARNEYKILDITNETTIDDYIKALKEILEDVKQAVKKINTPVSVSIYKKSAFGKSTHASHGAKQKKLNLVTSEISEQNFLRNKAESEELKGIQVYHIDPVNAVMEQKKDVTLYRINIKSQSEMLFLTNIIFFNNERKTLPIGMDLSDKVLIDHQDLELEFIRQDDFIINEEVGYSCQSKKVSVLEYNLKV